MNLKAYKKHVKKLNELLKDKNLTPAKLKDIEYLENGLREIEDRNLSKKSLKIVL
jgi:hypothetical protein